MATTFTSNIERARELMRRSRNCCSAFATPSTATSASTAAAAPPGHYFQDAARIGVSKINVNSDLRCAYRTTLEAQLRTNPDQYAVVKIIGPVIDAVQQVVEERIDLFGSAGQAKP
jgi:Fructose-bisphosphate aldolase class-II